MTGIEGRLYRPLALTVVSAMGASLVLSLTLVPALCAWFLTGAKHDSDVAVIRAVKRVYVPALDWAFRHAGLVRALALAVTIPAFVGFYFVGTEFMPELDEGALLVQTVLPPEASLAEVDRVNRQVEAVLTKSDGVAFVSRRSGRSEETEDPMPHTLSDILVALKPPAERADTAAVQTKLRTALEDVPGVTVLFTTPLGMRIDEGLGGTPADISVRIFGPDAQQLADLADAATRIMRSVDGMEDVRADQLVGLPQLAVQVDREAAARVGLTPGDVIEAVQTGLAGEKVSEMWIGQRRFDLTVVLSPDFRRDAATLAALLVDGHDGSRIPLGKLAKIEPTFGLGTIKREAGSRRIAVEASVAGRDLGSAARDVKEVLAQKLKLPAGYFLDVGGKIETQARAQKALYLAVGLALLAVFLLLYAALGSLAETIVILATLPSAFVGGIVALAISGESWSVSSLVGLIGLFGIAVQNGLVLVTQTRGLVSEGHAFTDALREACIGRVRPKIMTAATAILGLLPLLVLRLHGTEIERPLAIVMIGGLITSTVFTLLALPTFYQLVHDLGRRWAEPTAASPAVSPSSSRSTRRPP